MKYDPFHNLGRIWPDYVPEGILTSFMEESPSCFNPVYEMEIRHCAFTIGFFGFHYIRAVNEDEPALVIETLEILEKLVAAVNLDPNILEDLRGCQKKSYSDFWAKRIKKIAMELEDHEGEGVSQSMELGFWVAAVYACFVGILAEDNSGELKGCLKLLENWMIELQSLAQNVEIDEFIAIINKLSTNFKHFKTSLSACKCRDTLELELKRVLCSFSGSNFL